MLSVWTIKVCNVQFVTNPLLASCHVLVCARDALIAALEHFTLLGPVLGACIACSLKETLCTLILSYSPIL